MRPPKNTLPAIEIAAKGRSGAGQHRSRRLLNRDREASLWDLGRHRQKKLCALRGPIFDLVAPVAADELL
jgi:hypothetical protein